MSTRRRTGKPGTNGHIPNPTERRVLPASTAPPAIAPELAERQVVPRKGLKPAAPTPPPDFIWVAYANGAYTCVVAERGFPDVFYLFDTLGMSWNFPLGEEFLLNNIRGRYRCDLAEYQPVELDQFGKPTWGKPTGAPINLPKGARARRLPPGHARELKKEEKKQAEQQAWREYLRSSREREQQKLAAFERERLKQIAKEHELIAAGQVPDFIPPRPGELGIEGRDWLNAQPLTAYGKPGREDLPYKIAMALAAGVHQASRSQIPSIVLEFFTKRCEPPWPEGEVKRQLGRVRKEFEPQWLAESEEAAAKRTAAKQQEEAQRSECEVLEIEECLEIEDPELSTEMASEGRSFLVDGLLERRELSVLAGPIKAQKTGLLTHIGICVGTGKPVLGRFPVKEPCRVLYCPTESARSASVDIANRVCRSMGLDFRDLKGQFDFCRKTPSFDDDDGWAMLAKWIRRRNIGLVIVEPLYLALGLSVSPSDTNAVGILLKNRLAMLPSSCTLIIGDHGTKPSGPGRTFRGHESDTMQLNDISYAASARECGNWILVKHRNPFDVERGLTWLSMNFGGRAGHGGELALDIVEGPLDVNGQRDRWEVSCRSLSEARPYDSVTKKQAKDSRQDVADDQVVLAAVDAVAGPDGIAGFTKARDKAYELSSGRGRASKVSKARFGRAIIRACERQILVVEDDAYLAPGWQGSKQASKGIWRTAAKK
jgi:hypothetical protein